MAVDRKDVDRFDAWYSHKLSQLLPAVYRAEDQGALAELVERIGAQTAIVRRSIDRLWDDQSIETCDAWLIDYYADLLATNVVSSLDERERRVDVGKTIYYRRRKGTVSLLEELAHDISGWSVHVVEFFRRLSRTRHLLDPAIGLSTVRSSATERQLQYAQGVVGPRSHTQAGGYADLRNVLAASQASGGSFDEYFHTADVRRGRGTTGWYDIPRLGVFVWRLDAMRVVRGTPVPDVDCPNQYTFDPTGRDVPLFGSGTRTYGNAWISPAPHQVPGPISRELLEAEFADLYGIGRSLCVRDPLGAIPASKFKKASDDPNKPLWIIPELGRFYVHLGQAHQGSFLVDFHYGFSANVGANPRDRSSDHVDDAGAPVTGGDANLATVLGGLGPSGQLQLTDSLTYDQVASLAGIVDVAVRAKNEQRPVIRATKTTEWELSGRDSESKLELTGLFITGGTDVVIDGEFRTVTLAYCTLDPGRWDAVTNTWAVAADGVELKPSRLVVRGKVREIVIRRCILGPIVSSRPTRAPAIKINDSIIQSTDPGEPALELVNGELALERCTLLGRGEIHRFDASESILHDEVIVDDAQHGCVRFSAWARTQKTKLPRKYESVAIDPRAVLFRSTDFGQPAYAQLGEMAGAAIREGAQDGSEMGAFASAKASIKERSILIKFAEYLPLGLEPVIVHVT